MVQVFISSDDPVAVATVSKPRRQLGKLDQFDPAQVNWGAWGNQSPEVAEQFAQALLEAAQIAYQLNREKGL